MRRQAKGAHEVAKAALASVGRTMTAGYHAVSVVRWSLMRKRKVRARALLKLSVNGWTQRDWFVLSPLENDLVRQSAGMRSQAWVSPQRLHRSVRQITPSNVVTFANLSHLVRPVSRGARRMTFLDEIARHRRAFQETTLFRAIESGKMNRKHLGSETCQAHDG